MISTVQVDNGIVEIAKIDTTKFALKTETATKEEVQTLTSAVAGKLDASPQHHHEINDIDQLTTALNNKLDITQRYNYSSILSNPEEINYLNQLKTPSITLGATRELSSYTFNLDNNNLQILYVGSSPSSVIATYSLTSGKWIFGSIDLAEVLQNHHDAIEALSNNQVDSGASSLTVSETALTCSKKIVAPSFETSGDINLNQSSASTDQKIVFSNNGDHARIRFANINGIAEYGLLELATSDDGVEPIVVRQYVYGDGNNWKNIAREAYLLDASGNTSFPGTLTVKGPISVSRNASNESTQQYILNGRITGNDFATISFGRNDEQNGCGVLRYNYPNKFVSMGFWYNNELFKLDTNGNVNITGSISSPTITDILSRLEFVETVIRWLVNGEGQPPVFPNSS